MYEAFNVQAMKFEPDRYKPIGEEMYNDANEKVNRVISSFTKNGELNADLLTANWFPQMEADVFISHSHKDFDSVLSIAGWLYDTFGIISFIDSCVWGYSNRLLKIIDDEYCYNNYTELYDYNMRNLSTSHVHMMLSVALSKMIYNTEALFFYNTKNSVTPNDVIRTKNKTLSPWIYSEIAMTNLIEKRTPEEHRLIKSMSALREDFSREDLSVVYNIDTSNFPIIDASFFENWRKTGLKKDAALNYLYAVTERRKI